MSPVPASDLADAAATPLTVPAEATPAQEDVRATPVHCLNCEQPLLPGVARDGDQDRPQDGRHGGPRICPRFCPHCGQDTRLRAPTVGEFAREFIGDQLGVDGALWRTLRQLLLRPGALTREYLAGRRRRYVRPLRLYLGVSVLVLLAIGMLFRFKIEAMPPVQLDLPVSQFVVFDFGVVRAGLDRGRYYCEGMPAWACQRLEQRLTRDPGAIWQQFTQTGRRFIAGLGSTMFVLLPVFALLMRAAFAGRPWRYAEHLVFALHVHTVWFLVLAVAVARIPVMSNWIWLAAPLYALVAARIVYAGRWGPLLLRLAAVTLGYTALLMLGLVLLFFWTLLF